MLSSTSGSHYVYSVSLRLNILASIYKYEHLMIYVHIWLVLFSQMLSNSIFIASSLFFKAEKYWLYVCVYVCVWVWVTVIHSSLRHSIKLLTGAFWIVVQWSWEGRYLPPKHIGVKSIESVSRSKIAITCGGFTHRFWGNIHVVYLMAILIHASTHTVFNIHRLSSFYMLLFWEMWNAIPF